MTKRYDFGIIGAGPAGYNSAIRAAQLGKTVVLFEKKDLGGVCLNKGCIPTKIFLHCADIYNSLKKASNYGIEIENYSLNFEKLAERKEKTVDKIRNSLEMLLKSYDIEIVKAEAKVKNKNLIEANGEEFKCANILIATGSEAKCIGDFQFDHEFILSSDDILNLKTLPQKVLIVGSGAIGIEWVRIFSSFGVEVSIVEIADRLLPSADFDISKRLERIFKMAKIKIFVSTSVMDIKDKKVTLSNGEILEPDFVLFATGREINTLNNIEELPKIGDVFGLIQLAHFASHLGINVVENIVLNKEIKDFIVPSVIYGHPEIAWIGATEQSLETEKIGYKKSIFPISALGKAQADGDLEGFIKVLADISGKLLGVHIISKEASALIHQFSIAMQNDLGVNELKECCFAHPTYSEGVYEALLGIDKLSLSLLRG